MRPTTHRPHSAPRRLLAVLGVVALVLVLLQLLATPLARWEVRRSLAQMKGFEGRVEDVHASLFPPKVRVDGLRVIEHEGGKWETPLLSAGEVRIRLAWRKLADRVVLLDAAVDEPVIRIVETNHHSSESAHASKTNAPKTPNLAAELQRVVPLDFGVVHVARGRLTMVDETQRPAAVLTVSDIRAAVDNLTTRRSLAEHRPTTIQLTGKVQHTGELKVDVVAHPFAKLLDFSGKMEVRHLAAADLDSLLMAKEKMVATSGTLDVFADFRARDGHITGGVKPVAHDLKLAAAHDASLLDRFKSWLADAALDLFSDKEAGAQRVATVVPIRGTVTDPNVQLWPTVAGVLRNALVQGVSAGFGGLPPSTAQHEHSPPKQLLHALTGKGPPKAQPQGRKAH